MNHRTAFLFLLLFSFFISTAQDSKQVSPVAEVFEQQYPEAVNARYVDHIVEVQVHFTLGEDTMVAFYAKSGRWKETEKSVSFELLPADVKVGFDKSKFADWKVVETKQVYRAGGSERYRVKVEKNELMKRNLYFNRAGRLVADDFSI